MTRRDWWLGILIILIALLIHAFVVIRATRKPETAKYGIVPLGTTAQIVEHQR